MINNFTVSGKYSHGSSHFLDIFGHNSAISWPICKILGSLERGHCDLSNELKKIKIGTNCAAQWRKRAFCANAPCNLHQFSFSRADLKDLKVLFPTSPGFCKLVKKWLSYGQKCPKNVQKMWRTVWVIYRLPWNHWSRPDEPDGKTKRILSMDIHLLICEMDIHTKWISMDIHGYPCYEKPCVQCPL